MFGATVGESEEWELYEQVGKLKAIDVELEINGLLLLVKIMSNRGIVIFENLSEALSLKVLLELQAKLDEYAPKSLTEE